MVEGCSLENKTKTLNNKNNRSFAMLVKLGFHIHEVLE